MRPGSEKELYLRTGFKTLKAEGLLVGAKTFGEQPAAAFWHFHENSHMNFVIHGGVLDRRKNWETERPRFFFIQS
jgi:hypothetical protein